MRVLVGTDFHSNEGVLKGLASKAEEMKADVIVICGDLTHFGTLQQAKHLLSLLTGPKRPLLFVPGNCDPPSLVSVDMEGTTSIHGKSVVYGDLTFIGLGGSPPTPFDTPFEMSEEEIMDVLNEAAKNIPNNTRMVLVSHAPPRDTALDMTFIGRHVGSISVRKFIEERKPAIVFCGHIHEARGEDNINGTIIVNPGPARHGNYAEAVFDGEITVKFGSL